MPTKNIKWMQQNDTRRAGNLDQPEKKSYSQTDKNFNFLKTGVRWSSATNKTKLNHFSAI